MVNNTLDLPAKGRFVDGEHRFPLHVYLEDTDFSGLVYHANFIRYLERARSDMLRLAGIDLNAAKAAGLGYYAVTEIGIRYLSPARIDDDLLVLSRVARGTPARCVVHQRVTCEGKVLAEADVIAAMVGDDGRPRRQPSAWVAIFRALTGEE
jgi:acyl-CoA thioester hydrolase